MDLETVERLNEAGWVVECESPLEIRHFESDSFATGIAAQFIVEAIKAGEEI